MNRVIETFHELKIANGWKPLNTGVILSTTSIIKLAEECLQNGYYFFLGGRTAQDPLENVFPQIRRKAGSKPTALQARKALKMVCVSQYLSDIKKLCTNDADIHVLNVTKSKKVITTSAKSATESLLKIPPHLEKMEVSISEQNEVYYIAGAIANAMKKIKICSNCVVTLEEKENDKAPKEVYTYY